MLDPLLLEVLVCPEDRGPLWYFDDEQVLYNPRLRRKYVIREGIPVLLIEEGVAVDLDAHRHYSERAEREDVAETGQGRSAGTARQPVQPGSTEARPAADDATPQRAAEGTSNENVSAGGGPAGSSPPADRGPTPGNGQFQGANDASEEAAVLASSGQPGGVSGPDDPPGDIGGMDSGRTAGDHRSQR